MSDPAIALDGVDVALRATDDRVQFPLQIMLKGSFCKLIIHAGAVAAVGGVDVVSDDSDIFSESFEPTIVIEPIDSEYPEVLKVPWKPG